MYKIGGVIIVDSDGVVQNVSSNIDSDAWNAGLSVIDGVISPSHLAGSVSANAAGLEYVEGDSSAVSGSSLFHDSDLNNNFFYNGTTSDWYHVRTDYDAVITTDRGVFAGGYRNAYQNNMEYFTISTTGNATDAGDLLVARSGTGAVASATRGVWMSGWNGSNRSDTCYVGIATLGNATDFGNSRVASNRSGVSNNSRGVAGGNYDNNDIDYITIATTGNSTDFGDLTQSRWKAAAMCNDTRGVWAGGSNSTDATKYNTMDYVTIASTGNAIDFGDLTVARYGGGGTGNSTRGLIGGGYETTDTYVNKIEYITIATTGNSTDFGDLTVSRVGVAATNNQIRATFIGGATAASTYSNVIDYVTMATTGNATDFGDLDQVTISYTSALSGSMGL